jgi:hypothetical protein
LGGEDSRELNDRRIKIKKINPDLRNMGGFGSRWLNDLWSSSEVPGEEEREVIKLLEIPYTKGIEFCFSASGTHLC